MKNLIRITTLALTLMFLSAVLLSAQEHNHKHKTDVKKDTHQILDIKKIDKNKDGYVYQCPMKCEVPKDKEGECSKCGMNLKKTSVNNVHAEMLKSLEKQNVKNNLNKIDKNKDDKVFQCPMKCELPKDKAGECSKCGMNLKEVSI